jgi:hypothetical protein
MTTFYVEAYSKADNAEQALRHIGDYESLEAAIAASKRTIDSALLREHTDGMAGTALFEKFQSYGEMPCIFRSDDKTLSGLGFNALNYAKQRAAELCGK